VPTDLKQCRKAAHLNYSSFIFHHSLFIIKKGERYMKATGIVRRVDDLGRIVIPKEIRRTLKIREGDPSHTTLTPIDRFCLAIHSLAERITAE